MWDVKNCRLVRILEEIVKYPSEVNFVADDSLILIYSTYHALASAEKSLTVVTELGEIKYSLSFDAFCGYCICGSSKDILVGFMKNKFVNLYDIRTGKLIEKIQGYAFNDFVRPSGKHILITTIVFRDLSLKY